MVGNTEAEERSKNLSEEDEEDVKCVLIKIFFNRLKKLAS